MEWKAQRKSETKVEDKGESEEAAAEIESGGRRKEIADEAIRRAVCVEVERLTPPLDDCLKSDMIVSTEKLGLFLFCKLQRLYF